MPWEGRVEKEGEEAQGHARHDGAGILRPRRRRGGGDRGGAYLPLPSAAGVPGTDGKWHSLTSGKAYLPADVPCGVEDSYSALPPATGTAEEVVEPGERLSGETEGTTAAGSTV